MHHVEHLHDCSAIVGNCDGVALVNKFVHSTRTQSGADGVHDGRASIDVGDELSLTLRGVGPLSQDDNARLLPIQLIKIRHFGTRKGQFIRETLRCQALRRGTITYQELRHMCVCGSSLGLDVCALFPQDEEKQVNERKTPKGEKEKRMEFHKCACPHSAGYLQLSQAHMLPYNFLPVLVSEVAVSLISVSKINWCCCADTLGLT